MKRGQSYITLTDANKDHPLVKALHAKGITNLEVVYSPTYATQCGWDMLGSNMLCIGWDGWLGYTKDSALKQIERIEVRDGFLYLK